MTGDERETLEADVFAVVFTREKHLAGADRIKAALRAAKRVASGDDETAGVRAAIEMRQKDPIVPNDIGDERARKIIAAIALKHDTTSADIRSSSRAAATVAAREDAAHELARAGFGYRAVARLLGRSSPSWVAAWIENHESRVAWERAQARGTLNALGEG